MTYKDKVLRQIYQNEAVTSPETLETLILKEFGNLVIATYTCWDEFDYIELHKEGIPYSIRRTMKDAHVPGQHADGQWWKEGNIAGFIPADCQGRCSRKELNAFLEAANINWQEFLFSDNATARDTAARMINTSSIFIEEE